MREKVQLSNVLWNTVLFVLKYRDKNQPQFSLYNPCNWVTPFLQFTQKSTVIPFFLIFLSSTCWIFFLPFNRAYIFFYNSCINIFQEACVFFKKIIRWGWPEVVCKFRPETRKDLTLKNTSKRNKTTHKLFPHAAFTAAPPPSWDWLLRSQPDWTAASVNGVFSWHSCYTYQGPTSLLPAARPKWATRLVCDWQQQPRKKKWELCRW